MPPPSRWNVRHINRPENAKKNIKRTSSGILKCLLKNCKDLFIEKSIPIKGFLLKWGKDYKAKSSEKITISSPIPNVKSVGVEIPASGRVEPDGVGVGVETCSFPGVGVVVGPAVGVTVGVGVELGPPLGGSVGDGVNVVVTDGIGVTVKVGVTVRVGVRPSVGETVGDWVVMVKASALHAIGPLGTPRA